MKNTIKYMAICAVALLGVSCIDKTFDKPAGDYGTLSISSVGVTEDIREKNHTSTRSGEGSEIEVGNFDVLISSNTYGTTHHDDKYSTLPATMELPAGEYTIYIESHDVQDAEFDNIHYSVSQDFTITKGQTTNLGELVCRVTNILVSVKFHNTMKEAMADDCKVEISIGDGTLEYDLETEDNVGTFKAAAETNMLSWTFTGTLDNELRDVNGVISNVKAGEHRTLTFNTEYIKRGDGTFELVVSPDVTIYDVNLNVTVGEEEVIEPFALPTITPSPGSMVDLDVVNTVNSGTALVGGVPAVSLGVTVAAPEESTLSTIILELSTDNQALAGILAMQSLSGPIDLATTDLSSFGLPYGTDIAGQESVNLEFAWLIPIIFDPAFGLGNVDQFDIAITPKDAGGFSDTKTMRLKFVDDSVVIPVTITGDGIDERKVIPSNEYDSASVVVNIAVPAGIANFYVKITSNNPTFTSALGMMGDDEQNPTITLADEFDLANPGGLATLLSNPPVELPNGDEVLGKTELPFDISNFIGLMGMLKQPDVDFDADFQMRIVDSNGEFDTKTLKLRLTN